MTTTAPAAEPDPDPGSGPRAWFHGARTGDVPDVNAIRRRLEEAIARRRVEAAAIQFRLDKAHRTAKGLERELQAMRNEIVGLQRGLEALEPPRPEEPPAPELEPLWSPAPVLGFRQWAVRGGRLHGARMRWDTPELEAACSFVPMNRSPAPNSVPHTNGECSRPPCGIYAYKLDSLPRRLRRAPRPGTVTGVVAMTGKVVEHDYGFRAQRARAVAVVLVLDPTTVYGSTRPEWIALLFDDVARAVSAARVGQAERIATFDNSQSTVDYLRQKAREWEEIWT